MTPLQQELIDAALPNVVFDGWNMALLRQAATDLGKPPEEADRAFAGGVIEALNVWTAKANQELRHVLEADYNLPSMKIRERIATAIMVKLRAQQPHREAVRRALGLYAMPWHAGDGLASLYSTCDTIWRAAGDTSTDWNFYSKRMLLAKVYMTTLYVWLDDESENQAETEAFLHRRIQDVMQIQKVKGKLSSVFEHFRSPFVGEAAS